MHYLHFLIEKVLLKIYASELIKDVKVKKYSTYFIYIKIPKDQIE